MAGNKKIQVNYWSEQKYGMKFYSKRIKNFILNLKNKNQQDLMLYEMKY